MSETATISMKMMCGCLGFAAIAIVLVSGGIGIGAFFVIPCVLMMGMMMYMMVGNGQRSGHDK